MCINSRSILSNRLKLNARHPCLLYSLRNKRHDDLLRKRLLQIEFCVSDVLKFKMFITIKFIEST